MAEEKSNHALTCKIWKTPNHTFFVCEGRQKHRLLVKINFESKYFRWHTPVGGVQWKSSYTKIMVSGGRYVGRIGRFSSFHKGSEKKVEKLLEREKCHLEIYYKYIWFCCILQNSGNYLQNVWICRFGPFRFLKNRMFSCVFKHLYSFQTFFGTKGTQPAEQAKIKEIRLLAQEQRNMFSEEVSFHTKFITCTETETETETGTVRLCTHRRTVPVSAIRHF